MRSRLDKRLEIVENTFKKYSERRRKNIQKSLIRPLYQEILKCIFIITIMIFDTFIILEILIIFNLPLNIILFFVFSLTIIYIEIIFYNKLWGKNGKWSIDKYKKEKNN